MKIAITGGTGFLGQRIIDILIKSKHKVLSITRNSNPSQKNNLVTTPLNTQTYPETQEAIDKFRPEAVIHLASYLTPHDDPDIIENLITSNILFGTLLLSLLRKNPPQYFINTGSFTEYTQGHSPPEPAYLYSSTKTAFREILRYFQKSLNFKLINIIPSTIYGRTQTNKKVLDYIIESLDASTPIAMTDGYQKLDFVHVKDAALFYQKVVDALPDISSDDTTFYLGTLNYFSLRDVAQKVASISTKTPNIAWSALKSRSCAPLPISTPGEIGAISLETWKPKVPLEDGLKELVDLKNEQG